MVERTLGKGEVGSSILPSSTTPESPFGQSEHIRLPCPGVLFIYRTMDANLVEGDELTPLHPNYVKVVRLATLVAALPFVIVALILEFVGELPHGAALVPVLLAVGYLLIRVPLRRYQARGYQLGGDRLRVVRGLLFRKDTVVPFGRVQHIDVQQGPLERGYGLATLVLHTAGTHNASVTLPGLAHEDAVAMREDIRAHVKRETM